MAIQNLSEVIVYVNDMARAVEFYRDKLGLSIAWPDGKDDYSGEMWVSFSTGGCSLALHGGLELVPKTVQPRFGFSVADIAAERAVLLAKGVECSEVRSPGYGVHVVDCRDPEGNGFFLEHNEHH